MKHLQLVTGIAVGFPRKTAALVGGRKQKRLFLQKVRSAARGAIFMSLMRGSEMVRTG